MDTKVDTKKSGHHTKIGKQTRGKIVVDYCNYLEEKSTAYETVLALGKVSTAAK